MKKNLIFIVLAMLLCGCSNDNNDVVDEKQTYSDIQNELYNKVRSVIVGHWVGAQHYNRAEYNSRPVGWEDISYISWTQEYIFHADGTCEDIFSPDLIRQGTYEIVKNDKYLDYPSTQCELFINIKKDGYVETNAIWIDANGYLYIATPLHGNAKPSYTNGGAASVRYKKIKK